MALAVADDDLDGWLGLCRLLGCPDLADDPRFATHAARKANEDALDAVVAAWTGTRDKWEAAETLQAAGVAAAPVEDLADAIDRDPALSRWVEQVRQPCEPDIVIPVPGEAIQVAGAHRLLHRAPTLGEHDDAVLGGILGLGAEEIAGLRSAGVVWGAPA